MQGCKSGSTFRPLNREEIRGRLVTKSLGRDLLLLDKCTSTNDILTQQAKNGAQHGHTVISEEQTEGRGRSGRSWVSPRGGIWMSILLRPPPSFGSLEGLPLVGALALARAIKSTLNIEALVKWPNDVVVNGRKLAGVLVESRLKGTLPEFIILGMGANANLHATILGDTATNSTSLLDVIGTAVDRELLICEALKETEWLYELLCSSQEMDVLESVRRNDWSRGKHVRITFGEDTVSGIFGDYEELTSVRINQDEGGSVRVETSAVRSVEYL